MRSNSDSVLVAGGAMASNITSPVRSIKQRQNFAVQVDITSPTTLSGTLRLEGRIGLRRFTPIQDASFTLTSVAANTEYVFNVGTAAFDDVRLVWVRSAGSGTMDADFRAKEAQ